MKTAEDMVKEQKHEILSVSPETTIREALVTMTSKNIGAILIKEGGKIVGIWTERDLMRNVLKREFNLDTAIIKDYMTKDLFWAKHSETIPELQDKFLGLRVRHLLVRNNETFIGMVSSGDVTKHSLQETTEELKSLNKIVSWEYYENWRW